MFFNIVVVYPKLVTSVEIFVELLINFNSRNLGGKDNDEGQHAPEKWFAIMDNAIAKGVNKFIFGSGSCLHA